MAKTPSEHLYDAVTGRGGAALVEATVGDAYAAIEAAQAEARAEERERIWNLQAEKLDDLEDRVGMGGDACLGALEAICAAFGDRVPDEEEP